MSAATFHVFREGDPSHHVAIFGEVMIATSCGMQFNRACIREGRARQCRNCQRIAGQRRRKCTTPRKRKRTEEGGGE